MNLSSIHKAKSGSCPHGCPLGACPICNGMGGGGGKCGGVAEGSRKANGEMSWDQCFAIWQQMLKAQKAVQQDKMVQTQIQVPLNTVSMLENMAQKIAGLAEKLSNFIQNNQIQSMPKIISKPLMFAAKIAIPVLNVLKNIPVLIQNTINLVREKFADISDKLNAFFGELKNSTEKKISDRLKDFKKKFKSLFGIGEVQDAEEYLESENTFTPTTKNI